MEKRTIKMLNKRLLVLMICAMSLVAAAQREAVKIPAELQAFVETDTKPIEFKSADLNSDGKMDYILVLANTKVAADYEFNDESKRPTLIIIRGADGKLTEAARNLLVAGCAACGGVWATPSKASRQARDFYGHQFRRQPRPLVERIYL